VNLRIGGMTGPGEGPIGELFEILAKLREDGLIKHLGVSNVTLKQLEEARSIAPVAEVQNAFNIGMRGDAPMVDACAELGIAYVPFFPLGSAFGQVQWDTINTVAARHDADPRQIGLAWLLARSPSILLIPGTSSIGHLEQNVAAASIGLSDQDRAELDSL
jgi:aryl-alcohol dehydrogenase-like predicted oxidoreductase